MKKKNILALMMLFVFFMVMIGTMANFAYSCISVVSPPVTLTVLKETCKPNYGEPFGDITPDVGNYTVPIGTNLTFTANSNAKGWTFAEWDYVPLTGCPYVEYTTPTVTITVTKDAILSAVFNPTPQNKTVPPPIPPPTTTNVTLTVIKETCKPNGGFPFGDINPDVGNYTVPIGTTLTFTAINDNGGWLFQEWDYIPYTGGTYTEYSTLTVSINVTQNAYLTAIFNPIPRVNTIPQLQTFIVDMSSTHGGVLYTQYTNVPTITIGACRFEYLAYGYSPSTFVLNAKADDGWYLQCWIINGVSTYPYSSISVTPTCGVTQYIRAIFCRMPRTIGCLLTTL